MKRKDFLKRAALGALGAGTLAKGLSAADSVGELLVPKHVGYNHLPNKEIKTMKTVFHPAKSRGHANHGWLNSHHSFSFANYYNPERMNFGVLRVLNDDVVSGGMGFGTHPHDNMEIISIPLKGALKHKDSTGNEFVIREDDVQIMSAGTGIYHSEFNADPREDVNFLQIWVLPKKRDIQPRYEQITYPPADRINDWQTVVSPEKNDGTVWINQDAYFSLGKFEAGNSAEYKLRRGGNGVYVFVLSGEVRIGDQELQARDGYGLWDTENFELVANSDAEVLLMDVPMDLN